MFCISGVNPTTGSCWLGRRYSSNAAPIAGFRTVSSSTVSSSERAPGMCSTPEANASRIGCADSTMAVRRTVRHLGDSPDAARSPATTSGSPAPSASSARIRRRNNGNSRIAAPRRSGTPCRPEKRCRNRGPAVTWSASSSVDLRCSTSGSDSAASEYARPPSPASSSPARADSCWRAPSAVDTQNSTSSAHASPRCMAYLSAYSASELGCSSVDASSEVDRPLAVVDAGRACALCRSSICARTKKSRSERKCAGRLSIPPTPASTATP
mmetsp:Transcript_20962/g.67505  ORF Transcript_20962/g.67505 Transcript_20962/m.67505 type:complete len:269 (+) Transcript_20962:5698-6504(+)